MVEMVYVLRNSLDDSYIARGRRKSQVRNRQRQYAKGCEEATHITHESLDELYEELYPSPPGVPDQNRTAHKPPNLTANKFDSGLVTINKEAQL